MTAGYEIHSPKGKLLVNSTSKIIVSRVFRRTPSVAVTPWLNYFFTGQEEVTKTILVRPAVLGNYILASTPYSASPFFLQLNGYTPTHAEIANNTGNAVEVALCDVGAANESGGIVEVYAPDGAFSWSLASFIKGVKILSVTPITGIIANTQWVSIPIPTHVVDLNNIFIIPPYHIVHNRNNGTDSAYSVGGFGMKIIGRNLMFLYTGYNNQSSNPALSTPVQLVMVELSR